MRHQFILTIFLSLYPCIEAFSDQINDTTRAEIDELKTKAEQLRAEAGLWQHPMTCVLIAEGMLDLADERRTSNDEKGAERAVQYAQEAIQRANRFPHGQTHSGQYSLRFSKVEASSESFITGQTYEVNITWIVIGDIIDRDYGFMYSLLDESGRVIKRFEKNPQIPTSKWEAGEHTETITVSVPAQMPPETDELVELQSISAGTHYLAVTVYDPQKDTEPENFNWLLLDNPEALYFFPVGRYYILKEVYITPHPVQITELLIPNMTVRDNGDISIGMLNVGQEPKTEICHVRVMTELGTVVHEAVTDITLSPDEERTLHLNWEANFVGNMILEVRLVQNGSIRTWAKKRYIVRFLDNMLVGVARDHSVMRDSVTIHTPILVSLRGLRDAMLDYYMISVWNESEQLDKVSGFLKDDQNDIEHLLTVEPTWGYYYIRGTFSEGRKEFFYEKRIVGTVVETDSTDILVNGEPFIIKGINVNGLWSNSRELSDRAMKLIKNHGFNSMRGIHPNKWLVELAHENNLCFVGVTDFSNINPGELYDHFAGDPLGGCQEITRQYILSNREQSAMLFWNSCNMVVGELEELLITLYPCFKVYDHYARPVINAMLIDQDNWRGQDIMGIKAEFNHGKQIDSLQSIIEHRIDVGREFNLPVIFTEYNSLRGPVELGGEEAVLELGQFGIDHGMSGGVLYSLIGTKDKYPGLLDDDSRLHVPHIISDALKRYNADVEVGFVRRYREKVTLAIRNKRRCMLRKVRLELSVRGKQIECKNLSNLIPEEMRDLTIWLPRRLEKDTVEVLSRISFETHFGLRNTVEGRVFVK